MRKMYIPLCILFVCLNSCSKENIPLREITDNSTRTEDDILLGELYEEILTLSNQEECTDSDRWEMSPIGSKACGGPTGYIAYSLDIDTDDFLEMVEHYTNQQSMYNTKWGVFSTCEVLPGPIGVSCENGEPVLVF